MNKLYSLSLLIMSCVLCLTACNNHSANRQINANTKLLDFGNFTMRVPKDWKYLGGGYEDSYVGNIQVDSNVIVSFDLGWYSNPLDNGSQDYFVRHDSLFVARMLPIKIEGKDYIFDYKGKPDNSSIAPLRVNQKQWIQVDGYKAKLITPTQVGTGTTGVYIDSLWKAGNYNDKFQLSAGRLNGKQQQQLVAAIKTLKFYQYPDKRKENDE